MGFVSAPPPPALDGVSRRCDTLSLAPITEGDSSSLVGAEAEWGLHELHRGRLAVQPLGQKLAPPRSSFWLHAQQGGRAGAGRSLCWCSTGSQAGPISPEAGPGAPPHGLPPALLPHHILEPAPFPRLPRRLVPRRSRFGNLSDPVCGGLDAALLEGDEIQRAVDLKSLLHVPSQCCVCSPRPPLPDHSHLSPWVTEALVAAGRSPPAQVGLQPPG